MGLEYNKTSQIVLELVKDLFNLNVGDKLRSVREYVKLFDTSQGTVQNALNYLVETGGIAIDKRGSRGSFLSKFDFEIILGVIDKQHLLGCMPLPYSKRYEGLASGLSGLGKGILRFHLMYMRGSENRISRLLEGSVDYAILSHAAALNAINNGVKIEIAKAFGKQTFVSKHVLVKSRKYQKDDSKPIILGVDETSLDQIEIAKILETKMNLKLKYINASLIRNYLDSGEIDATIWNYDEIKEKHLNYEYEDLKDIDELDKFTETVLVIKLNDHFTRRIIQDEVDKEKILKIQEDVINMVQTPVY